VCWRCSVCAACLKLQKSRMVEDEMRNREP
jgi:hypothetical protein